LPCCAFVSVSLFHFPPSAAHRAPHSFPTRRSSDLEAGKHVLCEKPIAMNAAEARELLAIRDRNGVMIGEAFMVRTHPQWVEARRDRKSTRLNSSHVKISYAVFCLKKKKHKPHCHLR